jgi:hypothetical protein
MGTWCIGFDRLYGQFMVGIIWTYFHVVFLQFLYILLILSPSVVPFDTLLLDSLLKFKILLVVKLYFFIQFLNLDISHGQLKL